MPKPLRLAPFFALAGLLAAAPALAGESWDHRAMQSHHQAVDRVERKLAPGEKRVGRIELGAAASSSAQVPETLPTATQRQWIQRGSFNDPTPQAPSGTKIQAGRHNGTHGASHSSPGR